MSILMNQTKKQILAKEVFTADSFFLRLKGLMFKGEMGDSQVLFIPKCNSIHTFFMNFAIDAIFVDKNLIVKRVVKNILPNKLVWPVLGARHVFEMKHGLNQNIEIGDSLSVEN